jgi:hypothetical protein
MKTTVDIKTIPDEELEQDLADSYKDVVDCTNALNAGITRYSGGLVQERLNKNKQFIAIITSEIKRRSSIIEVKPELTVDELESLLSDAINPRIPLNYPDYVFVAKELLEKLYIIRR